VLTPKQIKEKYAEGENISQLLRKQTGEDSNTSDIIELSYDMQTGSYIDAMQDQITAEHKAEYSQEIAKVIMSLCAPKSVLEAGVGEATTLSGVLQCLPSSVAGYGFDISWSRVAFANQWLNSLNIKSAKLCLGDLQRIPFADDSIDVVYTSHSIEPNGGSEGPILEELYRVTKKYLVLLEPGYELAGTEAKHRMDQHGYCKNLPGVASELGYDIRQHELFPHIINPLNPTAITIIKKESPKTSPTSVFACPKFGTPLIEGHEAFYSPEALCVYPVIVGVPCLRVEHGIFASKYVDVNNILSR
jgi:hypothetical protein